MDIPVVGLGYVGAEAVAALSKAGHNVLGVDVDQGKVSSFRQGICPFYEPELSEFTSSSSAAGRLCFHRLDGVKKPLGEIVLVAVGMPTQVYGKTDLPQVY
jgi:UDPglucose 6-dehydrogenase